MRLLRPLPSGLRRAAVLVVTVAGVAATAASDPSVLGADVSGGAGPFNVSLDEANPDAIVALTAVLNAGAVLEENSGRVSLSVDFPEDASGQMRCSIDSVTTGAHNETDVFSPTDQPSVSLGIDAFDGCDGLVECGESFELHFERLEANISNTLSFDWSVSGAASTVDTDAAEPAADGTLTFAVE